MYTKFTILFVAMSLLFSGTATAANFDTRLAKECTKTTAWMQAHAPRVDAHHVGAGRGSKEFVSEPRLQAELAQRFAKDQKVRKAWIMSGYSKTSSSAMMVVDKDNLGWLKTMISTHGFPTVNEVGREGVKDAWTLVQHAGGDPTLQSRVLHKIKSRLGPGGVSRQKYAMLYDRVQLEEGKKQIYGTQFMKNKNGKLQLRPLEDPKGLDQRRASMGLMPLVDYKCMLRIVYETQGAAK